MTDASVNNSAPDTTISTKTSTTKSTTTSTTKSTTTSTANSTALNSEAIAGQLRFHSDSSLYQSLMDNSTIARLAKQRLQDADSDGYRRRLLGNGLRINATLAPQLFSQIDQAQQKLGLSHCDVEAYICSSAEANASCALLDDHIVLTFTSGLLQSMDADEIAFVIGHELGHALFRHGSLPISGILNDADIDADLAMQLMSWSRRAEISADRAGLYVCENPQAAIRAFLRLSCGLADPVIRFDLTSYSEQMRDLARLANNLDDTSDCYASHPFNPIRVMAVDLYARSKPYQQLCNQPLSEDSLSAEQLDKEIDQALNFMEPVADDKKQRLIDVCLFWGGVWVAYADGEFIEAEAENLRQQVSADVYQLGQQQLAQAQAQVELKSQSDSEKSQSLTTLAKEQFEHSLQPLKTLAAPEKCALLQRLVVIARADQNIDDNERQVLEQAARLLAVDSAFITQIMMFLD